MSLVMSYFLPKVRMGLSSATGLTLGSFSIDQISNKL